MLTGKRILCAMDSSRPSEQALAHALALGRATGSTVEVLHVMPHTPVEPHRPVAPAKELRALHEAEQHLDELVRRKNVGARVPVEVRVAAGQPEDGIVVAAGTDHADLVVMGGDARSALARFFGGSVSDDVVHSVDRPVLVVPDVGADVPLLPPKARPTRVVVPVTFTPRGGTALAAAASFGHDLKAHLHLVHVLRRSRLRRAPSASDRAEARRQLELAAYRAGLSGDFSVYVLEGQPADEVTALAERVGADLVVVPMKRRHGLARLLGGTPERLLERARLPVLCVPESGAGVGASPSSRPSSRRPSSSSRRPSSRAPSSTGPSSS